MPPQAPPPPPADYDPLTLERPYPFQDLLGFELTAWSEGFTRIELTLTRAHLNRHHIPHGGIHAALLDTAMGYAGSFCPYPGRVRRAMTLSLTVNYLGQPKGTRLIAEGRQTGGGRKSYFVEGRLTDDTGALIATGSAAMRWRGNGGSLWGDPGEP